MNEITEVQARKVLEVVDAGLVSGLGRPKPGHMCVEAAVCFALGLPHGDEPSCVAPTLRSLKIGLNDSRWSSNRARTDGLRRLALAQLGSADALDEKEFVRRVVDYAVRVSTPRTLRIAASLQKDVTHRTALLDAANKCEVEGTLDSARGANKTASASAYASSASAYASAASAYAYASAASAYAYAVSAYAVSAYAVSASAYAYAAAAARAAAEAASDAAAAAAAAADASDKSLAEYAEAIVQILIDMGAPGCQWLYLTEAA